MNHTPMLLERLAALIQQSVREEAARHGLLPVHLQILAYLARANRVSRLPIAIAEYLGITRGTVSQSLALLERRGLIVKERDPRHGRRVQLALTPAAEAILTGGWTQRLEAAMQALPLDPHTFEAALRGLLTALQRMNGQRPFGVCRSCAHFLREEAGARCGLTGEALAQEQTLKLCREWTAPATAA
ncbi:MAG: MarR family transcriptional regulator [Burkholderiales bacterium]|nr:MarR family transcriptional regulator [Burkholderiales bacterium]